MGRGRHNRYRSHSTQDAHPELPSGAVHRGASQGGSGWLPPCFQFDSLPILQIAERRLSPLEFATKRYTIRVPKHPRVAELADALDLGSCARKGVGVRLPPLGLTMNGLTSIRRKSVLF